MRLKAATSVAVAAVLCVCVQTQNETQTPAGLGGSCTGDEGCVSGAKCANGTCVCQGHTLCVQSNPTTICVPQAGTANCVSQPCASDDNCASFAGTACREVANGKFCMVGKSAGLQKLDVEKTLQDVLQLGAVIAFGGIFIAVVCLVCIMTGNCSGDPRFKPVQGRGVPALKRRIPKALGGTKEPGALKPKAGQGGQPNAPPSPPPPLPPPPDPVSMSSVSSMSEGSRVPSDSGMSEASMSQAAESMVSGVTGVSAESASVVSEAR